MSKEAGKHIVFFKCIDNISFLFLALKILQQRGQICDSLRGKIDPVCLFFSSPQILPISPYKMLTQVEPLRFGRVSYFHMKCELIVLCVNGIYNRVAWMFETAILKVMNSKGNISLAPKSNPLQHNEENINGLFSEFQFSMN